MKICMLVGTDMSHDARVWKEAKTLAGEGHQVTVLAAHRDGLPSEERSDGVHVIRVLPRPLRCRRNNAAAQPRTSLGVADGKTPQPPRQKVMAGLRANVWTVRMLVQILRYVKDICPDVLHFHDADRLFIGGVAHFLLRKPFVVDSHEYVAGMLARDTWRSRWTHRWYMLLERILLPSALAVVTVTDPIGEKLTRRYRVRRLAIVHNYPFCQGHSVDRHYLRSRLPEQHRGRAVLLYQGRLTEHRGIEAFVQSVALLSSTAGVLIGSGPIDGKLKALADERRLRDRVLFIPQVPWDELARYTPGADLGFCLSQNTCENNYLAEPNKLFEYLMAGVPVIASDFPAMRRCVVDEGVGIVVTPDDPVKIAAEVSNLLKQPERLGAMRERAIEVSRTKYNWKSTAKTLVDLYRDLASELRRVQPC